MPWAIFAMFLMQFVAVVYIVIDHPADRRPDWYLLSAVAGLVLGSTGVLALVLGMEIVQPKHAETQAIAQLCNATLGLVINAVIAIVRYARAHTDSTQFGRRTQCHYDD